MEIAEFGSLGGWQAIDHEVARNWHIRAKWQKNKDCGASIADFQQEAKATLLGQWEQAVADCPAHRDMFEYLVWRALDAGIAASKSARHGGHLHKGRSAKHIRESNYLNEDGSSSFEDLLGSMSPVEEPDEWFPSDIASKAKAFEAALFSESHPLFPIFLKAQTAARFFPVSWKKALRRAYKEWSKTGRLPVYRHPGHNSLTHEFSCLVRSEDDSMPEEVMRQFSEWQKSEDDLHLAYQRSDKKYGLKSGKVYSVRVRVPIQIGPGLSVMTTSSLLPEKRISG